MVPKRDTRQEILTEAFLMYEDLRNSKFSLSEIAGKVGISKTAIFRHFKNKDALIQAMSDTVFSDFASAINPRNFFFARSDFENFSYEEFSALIETVLYFFINNPGYLGFALNSGIITKSPNDPFFVILKKNGVNFSDDYVNKADIKRFFRVYFCTESMIFFLARRACLLKSDSKEQLDDKEFVKSVIDILWNGISFDGNYVSKERRAELSKICEVKIPEPGEDERFFMAFTDVFNEYGIEGITIERISEKLNIAKSSLYSYFNNKEEYIAKMLSSELNGIMDMLSEKMKNAESLEETAYILLLSERNYLEQRPFVLTIHNWASQQGFDIERIAGYKKSVADEKMSGLKNKDYKIINGLSLKTFLGWVSSVIGTLKIYFSVPAENPENTDALFDLICFGVSKSFKK